MLIMPGAPADLINHVVYLATGKDVTAAVIYCYIRRQSDGNWWSLAAGGSWVPVMPTGADLPLATYIAQGMWKLNLPDVVTAALTEGDSLVCRMTDSEVEATATVTSDVAEYTVGGLGPGGSASPAAIADAVWDEMMSGHVGIGSFGKGVADILAAITVPAPAVSSTTTDYTNSKSGPGKTFPDDAVYVNRNRVEPLITPAQVRNRFLFGIPLVSKMPDPITKKAQVFTDDLIRDVIDRAVTLIETDIGIDVFPQQNKEKHEFDRQAYESFGFMKVRKRPVASIEALTITPPSGSDIYSVPLEWVETAYLPNGQINLIPLGNAIAYGTPANVGSGGALFLNVLGNQPWIPAFWQITYTSGFPDGMLPKNVNEAIGITAALDILSMLAATYSQSTSHSLGIDSLSQSVSTPGPQLYTTRIQELQPRRDVLVKKLKAQYGINLFSSHL